MTNLNNTDKSDSLIEPPIRRPGTNGNLSLNNIEALPGLRYLLMPQVTSPATILLEQYGSDLPGSDLAMLTLSAAGNAIAGQADKSGVVSAEASTNAVCKAVISLTETGVTTSNKAIPAGALTALATATPAEFIQAQLAAHIVAPVGTMIEPPTRPQQKSITDAALAGLKAVTGSIEHPVDQSFNVPRYVVPKEVADCGKVK